VLLANDAGASTPPYRKREAAGRPIAQFFSCSRERATFRGRRASFQTEMECRGRRQDGDVFFAHIWFSTYGDEGPVRASLQLFFRFVGELPTALSSICRQIPHTDPKFWLAPSATRFVTLPAQFAVVHSQSRATDNLAHNEDFHALGTLVQGLEKMAGLELRQTTQSVAESIDLAFGSEDFESSLSPSFLNPR